MTLLYFGNCIAITFGVPALYYYYNQLSENDKSYEACIYGLVAYILTQLVKMMLIATFVPINELETESFVLTEEISKFLIGSIIEVVGVSVILYYVKGKKILAVGLGWAVAESLTSKIIPMWIGARVSEFDWTYLLMALDSNINLIIQVAFVTFVALRQKERITPLVWFCIILHLIFPVVQNFLKQEAGFEGLGNLITHGIYAIITSVFAYNLYSLAESQK